jgi:hypothetical protein
MRVLALVPETVSEISTHATQVSALGHSKGACEGTELVTLAGNTGGGRSVA